MTARIREFLEDSEFLHRAGRLAREIPKRIYCSIVGHKMDTVQVYGPGWYDVDWEAYCERCCDDGDFDSLKRIPWPLWWWVENLYAEFMWKFIRSKREETD